MRIESGINQLSIEKKVTRVIANLLTGIISK